MRLSDFLSIERVILPVTATDKWELIALLARRLAGDGFPVSADDVAARVVERERQLSTGFERGIAIPHGMLDDGCPTRGVLGIAPDGVDFESLDEAPVHFILMMVFPDTSEGRAAHVSLLATTIRIFTDGEARPAILGAAAPGTAFEAIRAAEQRLGL